MNMSLKIAMTENLQDHTYPINSEISSAKLREVNVNVVIDVYSEEHLPLIRHVIQFDRFSQVTLRFLKREIETHVNK